VPVAELGRAGLTDGAIVLRERVGDGAIEVSRRKLTMAGRNAWLWPSSTHVQYQQLVPFPHLEDLNQSWSLGGVEKFAVHAVVAGAYFEFASVSAGGARFQPS
jgi:hypothetical protein